MDGLPDPVKANTRIRIYLSKRARGKLFKKESQSGPFQPIPHRFHLFSFCPNPAYHVPSPEFFSNSILPRPSPSRTNCLHSQVSASASIILVAFSCGVSSGKTGVQLRVFSHSKGSGAGRSSQIRTAQGWEPGRLGTGFPGRCSQARFPGRGFQARFPETRSQVRFPRGSQEQVPKQGFPSKGGQQNWSCGKKFPLLPCLVQVCYCYSGLQRGYPLWTSFLAFFNKGFIRKSAAW